MTAIRSAHHLRSVLAPAACLACVSVSGCVTAFDRSRTTLEAMHAEGRYDQAAHFLDDPANKDLYGDRNRLLYWMERGAVALAVRDDPKTIQLLEKAEDYTEVHREPTGGDELSRWILNDTAAPYYAEPYEEIYINVLKLAAQLEQGQIQGGATVEARRAASKSDLLRDRYITQRAGLSNTGDDRFRSALASTGGLVDANDAGQFIESTLGDYLTAVTFMKTGEPDFQTVAGRRLSSAIQLQRTLQGGSAAEINAQKLAAVGSMHPDDANVLIVGLSGRCPTKVPNRVGPIPIFSWPVYFELPELRGGSEEVGAVRVTAECTGPPGNTCFTVPQTYQLDKVEDLSAVAAENHRRQLPLIYARTLLRSQLKAAASFAATQAVRNSTRGSTRDLATIGMVLGGLAFVGTTEKADLRCWVFLPGRADVGLLKLPAGNYRVTVEYLSRSGGLVYTSPPRDIRVSGGASELVTVIEHYWR